MADATDCHGNWIFSGPDGIKPFSRYKLRDTRYIGHVGYSRERSSDVKHMWRAPWWSASNFPAKTGWVGAIGWNTWSYNDWRVLKSGHQISAGPFRHSTPYRERRSLLTSPYRLLNLSNNFLTPFSRVSMGLTISRLGWVGRIFSISRKNVNLERYLNMSLQMLGQQCWDMLCLYVAIVWPGLTLIKINFLTF